MKNKIKYIIWFLIIFIVFITINSVLFWKKIENKNLEKSIFNIISQTSINIDNIWDLKWKSENYKNIIDKKIIWKWFFIKNSWEFYTAKHLFLYKNSKFYIEINNKKYDFEILKKYENKDIILWKIKNYKNKINNMVLSPWNLYKWQKIFTYKNNKKIYWKILSIKENIKSLNLKNLTKTNIKLYPWDSWTPVFNEDWKVIWIFTAIKKWENISFFEKL